MISVLERFRSDMQLIAKTEKEADDLMKWATQYRQDVLRGLGVYYKDRGPDFSCWSHDELFGWYSHPEAVVVALEKERKEKANAEARLQEERRTPSEEQTQGILDQVAGRA